MKIKKAKIVLEITEKGELTLFSQGEPSSYMMLIQMFLLNLVGKLIYGGAKPQNLKKMIFLIMAPAIKELDRLEEKGEH